MTHEAFVIIRTLKKKFPRRIQMFDTVSTTDDEKVILYKSDMAMVLYAPYYEYVEVLGVSESEYKDIFENCGY